MKRKILLYVQKESVEDIREALDDILSSGLITQITDEKGNEAELEVVSGEPVPKTPEKAGTQPQAVKAVKKELARKTSTENGIFRETIMTQATRGEESCMGQKILLKDQGGGRDELFRQQMPLMLGMNCSRVRMMEFDGGVLIEGSSCAWYPF